MGSNNYVKFFRCSYIPPTQVTDASTEGQPTGVIEEEASPHVSYTTQVGLGSKRHDPSPVHAPLSNGIQFMGIYTEYG